jgi:hypothetical protein
MEVPRHPPPIDLRQHRSQPPESKPKRIEIMMACDAGRISIGDDGGGGNRTRVRGRTGQNVYKLVPPLDLARRPEADALPAGQPSFRCRTSGDGRSFGAEPVRWRRYPSHGPSSERRRHLIEIRQRVRDFASHLRVLPVDLRGQPATSACSSAGESTTSRPDRPRMFVLSRDSL